ncbi:MAG: hypothetical protein AB1656_05145 [Candidatus Omnitrophota bacterium]
MDIPNFDRTKTEMPAFPDKGTPEISFKDLTENKTDLLKAVLPPLLPLFPKWLHRVVLAASDNSEDERNVSDCSIDTEYRQAYIRLYPSFWEMTEIRMAQALIHEVLHIAVEPIAEVAKEFIESAYPDKGPFRDFSDKVFVRSVEGTVEDLARSIWEILAANSPEKEDVLAHAGV